MIISIEQSKVKYLYLLSLVSLIIFVSGCAGPKIANDLLSQVEIHNKPLINNTVTINVQIKPGIHNHEKIDESVKESLKIALINANSFGKDSSHPYRIDANIMVASQSPMSFGSFPGKLQINYLLFDDTNNKIIDETIYTEAGSDKWFFSGAARHRRSRAVNISKNVLQFVDVLQKKLNK